MIITFSCVPRVSTLSSASVPSQVQNGDHWQHLSRAGIACECSETREATKHKHVIILYKAFRIKNWCMLNDTYWDKAGF